MARTPLSTRTTNVVADVPTSKASAIAASQSRPRPSLLVQKLAERRQASNSPAIQRSRPVVAYAAPTPGVDLPTPPATRSPDRTTSATRVTHRPDQRSPPPSPSPRRRTISTISDENAQSNSAMDSSMSLSADSSTSSVRRSSRHTKQAPGKGISPALAPLVQNGKERNAQQSTARRPATVRSSSATPAGAAPSTARRTTKRKTPTAEETQKPTAPSTSQTGKRKAPPTTATRPARRPRTSLSQPLLTPPPSSSSHSLRPAHPAPQRASSTQPYSTPQQHRHRIFDVTKRRTAVTTITKRGVWRAGSLVSTGPDEQFNHTPIALRPESPTDDPILLKPTPKELEEERSRRQMQLQTLLDAENDRQGDDTFADVRARGAVNGVMGDTTLPSLGAVGLGVTLSSRTGSMATRTPSFAETGIDDIPEEDEEEEQVGMDHSRDDEEERSIRYDDDDEDAGADFGFDASGEAHEDEDDAGWDRQHDAAESRTPEDFETAADARASNDPETAASHAIPAEDTSIQDASMSFDQETSHDSDGQHMRESTTYADRVELAEESVQSPAREDGREVDEGPDVHGDDAGGSPEHINQADNADGEDAAASPELEAEDDEPQAPHVRPRFSDIRLPSVSPEVSDPLADSASFLLEEQMRSHSYHEDDEEEPMSEEGGDHGSDLERSPSEEQSDDGRSESQGSAGDEHAHTQPKEEIDEHESLLLELSEDDAGEEVHAGETETYSRVSYSLSPIASMPAAQAQTVTSPDERSYSRDTRADSLLSMLYSDSGRDMSPFVGINHTRRALPVHSTPLKMERQDNGRSIGSPEARPSRQVSNSPAPGRASPSRSYSTLGPNSTRLAMHSLARSTSIVEVLSTDAQAAARAAALLRVHHNWIHEGNLISSDDADDEVVPEQHPSFHGNVLDAAEHANTTTQADDTVLPDLLQDAESRLRATGADELPSRLHATPARHSITPYPMSAGPTPMAPGAYVFSPAGSPANLTLTGAGARSTPRAPQAPVQTRQPLPDLAIEVEEDPNTFSKAAWKGLDRAFRHVVREEAKGGRAFVKPGVMEKRLVVLSLDRETVVREFLNGYGIDDELLTHRWSMSNLLKSVSALQRKFFQKLEREYPGCLTPEEAAMADASIYGSDISGISGQQALSLPSMSQADDDRESLASRQTASPFEAPTLRPEHRPQTSTPLVSREKRMRRLDIYIPSPSRVEESRAVSESPGQIVESGRSVSPAPAVAEEESSPAAVVEDVAAESKAEEDDTTQRQDERMHASAAPAQKGSTSSVLYGVGSALKRRLSQVFSRRTEEPEERDESAERSASPAAPADEIDLSNATTVLDDSDHGMFNGDALTYDTFSLNDHATPAGDGDTGALYPALPAPSDSSLPRITPLPRVSLARERTDPAARLAAREQMQKFRDESLDMRRRVQASSSSAASNKGDESMPPPLSVPIRKVLEQARAEARTDLHPASPAAPRPRKSLLVSKLTERRNGNDSITTATHPRIRDLARRQSSVKHISPLGKRRAEELEHERRKRQALREESTRDEEESFDDSILGAGSGLGVAAR